MAKKRKEFTFLVTVTAPAKLETWHYPNPLRNVRAAEVAREIRTLISNQSMYSMDEGDVKVRRIRLAPASTPRGRG